MIKFCDRWFFTPVQNLELFLSIISLCLSKNEDGWKIHQKTVFTAQNDVR